MTSIDRDGAAVGRETLAQAGPAAGFDAPDLSGAGQRIVIIDPVKTTRDLMSYALEQAGYQPLPFSRPEEAVLFLEHHSADLVLTETASPYEPEQFDLKPLLQAADSIPVVIYTRRPELASGEEGAMLVPRPCNVRLLLDRIARLIAPASG